MLRPRRGVWTRHAWSWNSHQFVRLEADPPAWMLLAIIDHELGVAVALRPVHRLQEEVLEVEMGEAAGQGFRLRINQLQFLTRSLHQLGIGFRTDADPVDAIRGRDRPVGFD